MPVIATAVALFFLLGIGPNVLHALLSCTVLVIGGFLLWRPGEAPILLYIFLHQWLQATIALFYGNWRDLNLDGMFQNAGSHELATGLTLIGLFFLAIGMRVAAGPTHANQVHRARVMVATHPQKRYLGLFLGAWIIAFAAKLLADLIPGLSQLLLAIESLKWAAYFALTYVTLVRSDSSRAIWLVIFLGEFFMALGGYFSSFKGVLLFTLVAIGASQVRLSLKAVSLAIGFLSLLVFFAVIWTAIKPEYRAFVSGGEAAQIVTVSYQEVLTKIVDLALHLDDRQFGAAVESMIERIMYIEYFGVVLNYVPEVVPHEWGSLWFDAITRPVMPRIFFPHKAIIDESVLLNKYTGLGVAGLDQGTQITIGYMGETYIDFGIFGMMPFLMIVGFGIGRIYRWLMTHPSMGGILGISLAPAVLMTTSYLENSSAKIVGGLFASVIATWLISKYVVPRFAPWLQTRAC